MADQPESAESREPNPVDCNCEHIHASSPTCPSKQPSRGAVRESARMYPATTTAAGCTCEWSPVVGRLLCPVCIERHLARNEPRKADY